MKGQAEIEWVDAFVFVPMPRFAYLSELIAQVTQMVLRVWSIMFRRTGSVSKEVLTKRSPQIQPVLPF